MTISYVHQGTITAGGLTLTNFFSTATITIFDTANPGSVANDGDITGLLSSYVPGGPDGYFMGTMSGTAPFFLDQSLGLIHQASVPYTFDGTNNFFWRWAAGTDADATVLPDGNQIISSGGASGDSWTLRVNLENPLGLGGSLGAAATVDDFTNVNAGEQLLYDGQALNADGTIKGAADGTGPGSITFDGTQGIHPAVTFSGTGDASLADLFHHLSVNMPLGYTDFVVVQFQLIDTTTSSTTNFAQFFTNPACFVPGTRIATAHGEADVADLAIGDTVMTGTGVLRAIKWIGRRSYTAAQIAANASIQPVTVLRDAIAPGMPHRDLRVSPLHALFIDDSFVPAAALVNGVSVLRGETIEAVSYIHIELDQHDIVFAEGLPTETFVDDGSRLIFDNADEFFDLYGADAGVVAFSAPRLEEGVQLEAIRRRIAARAGLTVTAGAGLLAGNIERIEDGVLVGWMTDTTSSTAVELEIIADGEVIGTAIANRYRIDLDQHGINGGRAGFSIALPASVTSLEQVTVRRAGDGARIGGTVATATV